MRAKDLREYELYCELRSQGVPMDGFELPNSGDLIIRQEGRPDTNSVFDLSANGGTGVILDVVIANSSSRPVTIFDVDIDIGFYSDIVFTLLEEPNSKIEGYRFPVNHWSFPHALVVNHRIFSQPRITAGRPLHGWLLGSSTDSLPSGISHGGLLNLELTVFDELSMPHSQQLQVQVDRMAKRDSPPRRKPSTGLFEPEGFQPCRATTDLQRGATKP